MCSITRRIRRLWLIVCQMISVICVCREMWGKRHIIHPSFSKPPFLHLSLAFLFFTLSSPDYSLVRPTCFAADITFARCLFWTVLLKHIRLAISLSNPSLCRTEQPHSLSLFQCTLAAAGQYWQSGGVCGAYAMLWHACAHAAVQACAHTHIHTHAHAHAHTHIH